MKRTQITKTMVDVQGRNGIYPVNYTEVSTEDGMTRVFFLLTEKQRGSPAMLMGRKADVLKVLKGLIRDIKAD